MNFTFGFERENLNDMETQREGGQYDLKTFTIDLAGIVNRTTISCCWDHRTLSTLIAGDWAWHIEEEEILEIKKMYYYV